jgi:hypothetical protein
MRIEGDRANFRKDPVVQAFTFVLSTAVPPAGSFCGPSTAQHAHSPHFLPTARRPVILPYLGVCLEVFGSVNHPPQKCCTSLAANRLITVECRIAASCISRSLSVRTRQETASLDSRPLASSRGEELASPARSP